MIILMLVVAYRKQLRVPENAHPDEHSQFVELKLTQTLRNIIFGTS